MGVHGVFWNRSFASLSIATRRVTTTASASIAPDAVVFNHTPQAVLPAAARGQIVIHWFRHGDLRLLDNQALTHSSRLINVRERRSVSSSGGNSQGSKNSSSSNVLIPIFCFDAKLFGAQATSRWGNLRCSPLRAKFIMECVADLRQQLQTHLQLPLLVAYGDPAQMLDQLLSQIRMEHDKNSNSASFPEIHVVCQDETAPDERRAVESVQTVLEKCTKSQNVTAVWGSFLHSGKGMPYPNDKSGMPKLVRRFVVAAQKQHKLPKALLPIPQIKSISPIPRGILDNGMAQYMPTMSELGYTPEQIASTERVDPRAAAIQDLFRGGETAALARMNDYITRQGRLLDFCDTRNGLVGLSYSTKLSPWLAHGCLSPRTVALCAHDYVRASRQSIAMYLYTVCLAHRDYCRYYAAKYGTAIFRRLGGAKPPKRPRPPSRREKRNKLSSSIDTTPVSVDMKKLWFEAWTQGQTGYPFIDACMRELQTTGYMSNRGRLNCASFLIFDLDIDWRRGADWFESQLLDYDVSLNWVNWQLSAGLTGNPATRIDVVFEGLQYDPSKSFVKLWVPELDRLPNEYVHEPWKLSPSQQVEFQLQLGIDYPAPIFPSYPAPGSKRAQQLARSSMMFTHEQLGASEG